MGIEGDVVSCLYENAVKSLLLYHLYSFLSCKFLSSPMLDQERDKSSKTSAAVNGEPGFERQPIVYFLYLHIILALD